MESTSQRLTIDITHPLLPEAKKAEEKRRADQRAAEQVRQREEKEKKARREEMARLAQPLSDPKAERERQNKIRQMNAEQEIADMFGGAGIATEKTEEPSASAAAASSSPSSKKKEEKKNELPVTSQQSAIWYFKAWVPICDRSPTLCAEGVIDDWLEKAINNVTSTENLAEKVIAKFKHPERSEQEAVKGGFARFLQELLRLLSANDKTFGADQIALNKLKTNLLKVLKEEKQNQEEKRGTTKQAGGDIPDKNHKFNIKDELADVYGDDNDWVCAATVANCVA